MKDLEKNMKIIAEMQELEPDDRLTQLLSDISEEELSEDDLDQVWAAAKPDYTRFWNRLKGQK